MGETQSFSQWLRHRRRELDLTQDELARRVGCASISIRKIEADQMRPSRQLAELLAGKLELPIAEQAVFVRLGRGRESQAVLPSVSEQANLLDRIEHGPMVARVNEMATLEAQWQRVRQSEARVVFTLGEPGIGKTRLMREFMGKAKKEGAEIFVTECYADGDAPYAPIASILAQALNRSAETGGHLPDLMQPNLKSRLSNPRPAIADLLAVPQLDPKAEQLWLSEAFTQYLRTLVSRTPLVMCIEDIHWADSGTLFLLRTLIRQARTWPLFFIATFRESEIGEASLLQDILLDLNRERLYTQIKLAPLNRAKTGELLAAMFAEEITSEFLDGVYKTTEGNPFFIEELCKSLIEVGDLHFEDGRWHRPSMEQMQIPQTVRAVILARVRELAPDAQETLRLASILGQEFSFDLLHGASELDEDALAMSIEHAERAQLINESNRSGRLTFRFTHVLIPSTLRESLGGLRIRHLEERVAMALEKLQPENVEALAYHWAEAGNPQKAIPYLLEAGRRAVQHSADREAIAQLKAGLQLLENLPSTSDRLRQELDFQIALGTALVATQGYAAPEVKQVYERARLLAQQNEDSRMLFPVLWGLWNFYEVSGDFQSARQVAEQLLALAQKLQDPDFLLEAHRVLGDLLIWVGEFESARDYSEKAILEYDPRMFSAHITLVGEDPGACALQFSALASWFLGQPDLALKRAQEAIVLARRLEHPFTLAQVLTFTGFVHQFRYEPERVLQNADEVCWLSEEKGFSTYLAWGTVLRGWAMGEQGNDAQSIAQLEAGIEMTRSSSSEVHMPYYGALLAQLYIRQGQLDRALTLLSDVLVISEKNSANWYEAELYRLQGECLVRMHKPDIRLVEKCFQRAREVARSQHAKSLELRTAMSWLKSLERLSKRQARQKAHEQLAEIYGEFSEGFDTRDLQEAKALLQK